MTEFEKINECSTRSAPFKNLIGHELPAKPGIKKTKPSEGKKKDEKGGQDEITSTGTKTKEIKLEIIEENKKNIEEPCENINDSEEEKGKKDAEDLGHSINVSLPKSKENPDTTETPMKIEVEVKEIKKEGTTEKIIDKIPEENKKKEENENKEENKNKEENDQNEKNKCLTDYETYSNIGIDKKPVDIKEAQEKYYFFSDILSKKSGQITLLHFNPDEKQTRKVFLVNTDKNEKLILKTVRYKDTEVSADKAMNEYKICLKNSSSSFVPRLYNENPIGFYSSGNYSCFEVLFFYEGESLYAKLLQSINAKQKIPGKKLYQIARLTAEGFAELHKLKIFHSDIKPENIIWTEDEKIKIIDYGASKEDANIDMMTYSVLGEIKACTPGYVPPEYSEHDIRRDKSLRFFDVYSWGISMYQLCAGLNCAELKELTDEITSSYAHYQEFYDKIDKMNFEDLSEIENKTLKDAIRTSVSYSTEMRHAFDEIAKSLRECLPLIMEKIPFYKTWLFFISLILIAIIIILAIALPCTLITSNSSETKVEWKMIWSEEFNNAELSTDTWNYETSTLPWVKPLECTLDPVNVKVSEGKLNLFGTMKSNGSYYGAAISTKGKKTFKEGKIEARIKIPQGAGFQTNFILVVSDSSCPTCGLIYMLIGYGQLDSYFSIFKYGGGTAPYGQNYMSPATLNLYDDYIIISAEFYGNQFKYYLNGNKEMETNRNSNPEGSAYWPIGKYEFYIYTNFVVGRQSSLFTDAYVVSVSPTNQTKFPGTMSIDYIRFYEPILPK